MRDQHQRAGKFEQRFFEDLERRDIEIVRRLIKHQQIGGLQHQPREDDPRFLAAGELRHGCVELLVTEEKPTRQFRREDVAECLRRIEALAILIEIDDAQLAGLLDGSGIGQKLADDDAQQRRLARSIRPEDAEARARREEKIEIFEEARLAQTLPHPQPFGLAIGSGEIDFRRRHPRAIASLGQLADDFLGVRDPRLGLRRARLRSAPQPLHLAPHAIGERLLIGLFVPQQCVALLQEIAVLAIDLQQTVGVHAIELQHALRDVLEKVAIVTDDQKRLGLAFQERLEPQNRFDVEMVRRLVEQQDVRLEGQLARDRETFAPAAGERVSSNTAVREAGLA